MLRNVAVFLLLVSSGVVQAGEQAAAPRKSISLDGLWNAAQGAADAIPERFDHRVPVPGLLDMAEPPFEDVGQKSERRQAFWYRRTFEVEGELPEIAILKLHKAKYGTRVYLNRRLVGDHLPCFTPGYLDVHDYLQGNNAENELIVRVGADRESVPEGRPSGWDFEKYRYLPGIYDSIDLILTGTPRIVNVQIVPEIESATVRVVAEIAAGGGPWEGVLHYSVTEKASAEIAGFDSSDAVRLNAGTTATVSKSIIIENCRLWSPEDPFLYQIEVTTGHDAVNIPFGMRSFRFDRISGRALLNNKPYIMRGTNVCIYRFFEDSLRMDKPWRTDWVKKLHQRFKSMHWNSIRYCIGFPPEKWYDIADETGFLIQDEFPIWLLSRAPEDPQSPYIIEEYTEWMRERWNHPCVVIWDAQNESVTPETGMAIAAVRHLDLSNRPWENGWAPPQSPVDAVESHPYLFIRGHKEGGDFFDMSEMASMSGNPRLREVQKRYGVPAFINEYAWLWLNRDGSTTTLTKNYYNHVLGENATADQRFELYARYLAALTEFWRTKRECAGVLHFCGLGYARSGELPRPEGGATSDHFVDLEALTFEPHFTRYVRDAFSPVGLMLDFWSESLQEGGGKNVDVVMINDLDRNWDGTVRISILKEGKSMVEQKRCCVLPALGRKILTFSIDFPASAGDYELVAETEWSGEKVSSRRRFSVK